MKIRYNKNNKKTQNKIKKTDCFYNLHFDFIWYN
mgnify:CR=1 FL=1